MNDPIVSIRWFKFNPNCELEPDDYLIIYSVRGRREWQIGSGYPGYVYDLEGKRKVCWWIYQDGSLVNPERVFYYTPTETMMREFQSKYERCFDVDQNGSILPFPFGDSFGNP